MRKFLFLISIIIYTFSESYAQFANHVISNRAIDPKDMDVADLDGDGDLDIVSASRSDGKIAWYRNDGNNQIEAQFVLQSALDYVEVVHAADMDQDGDIDLLSEHSNKILLFTNKGNGKFEESKMVIDDVGGPVSILTGDINQDGRIDIIVANGFLIKGIYWYEQLEDNTFGERKSISAESNILAKNIAIADIDGDGDLDLAAPYSIGNSTNQKLSVFINNVNSFKEIEISSQTSSSELGEVALGHLNEDEVIDMVHYNTKDREIAWFEGEGEGNFGERQLIQTGFTPNSIYQFCLADFNEDEIVDICLLGGDFSVPAINCLLNDGTGNFTLHSSTPHLLVNDFLTADLNGDGAEDLLWCTTSDIAWKANNGEGNWLEENVIVSELRDPFFAGGMDVDKDGDLDIIGASSIGELVWYENIGDYTFGSSNLIHYESSVSNYPRGAAVMDIDENGSEDVVIALQGGSPIIWYTPDENGNMIQSGSIQNFSERVTMLEQVDLDQDGNLDLVTFDGNHDEIIWYRHDGNGQFAEGTPLINIAWDVFGAELVDANKDGNQDIILFSPVTDIIQWYEGREDGTFIEHPPLVDGGYQINDVQTGDFDSDGYKDILFVDASSWNILGMKNVGNGDWFPPSIVYDGLNLISLKKVVDINGNGLDDIIFDYVGLGVHIIEQTGAGIFAPHQKISSKRASYIFPIDLDQDGNLDLLNCDDQIIWHENQMNNIEQLIHGVVFMDLNENGIRDPNEFGLSNQKVILGPKGGMFFTNHQGAFSFFATIGQYGLATFPKETWRITNNPEFYAIDLFAESPKNPYNFGLIPLRPLTNVSPFIAHAPFRCNTTSTVWLNYQNKGTTTVNGKMSLETNGLAEFISADPTPDEIEVNKWTWYFEELTPSQINSINLQFQMPDETEIGAMIQNRATVEILHETGEVVFTKIDEIESELLCSYDPNDKLTRSNLLGQSEFAYIEDTIYYTIRFQNTGNDTAFNIRVEDVLDKRLDWTTFHPITASHDYRTELNRETGLATFFFDDIMLPDSTTNEVESHGFVTFGIASLAGIEDKTKVENTASIFFDFNPPIITNTAVLTLLQQVETGIEVLDNRYSIRVFPNPFSDYTTIEVDGLPQGNYRLEVMDILGRKVRELKVENGELQLERGSLESGLYLIRVLEEGNGRILGSGKVLVE
ncbi:MAG: FG-GAP-like repeat-containing protein [Chitinophagales bacterium]